MAAPARIEEPQEITKFARQVKDPLGETKSNMFFSYMV